MFQETSGRPISLQSMPNETRGSGLSAPLESPALPSSAHLGLTPGLARALPPGQGPAPALRGGGVAPFAVQSRLRTPGSRTTLITLQKCAGVMLTAGAWVVFLGGLAHLILAAVHNQRGELGVGLSSTLSGAKYCLAGFLLAGIGVPQWLMADRRAARAR